MSIPVSPEVLRELHGRHRAPAVDAYEAHTREGVADRGHVNRAPHPAGVLREDRGIPRERLRLPGLRNQGARRERVLTFGASTTAAGNHKDQGDQRCGCSHGFCSVERTRPGRIDAQMELSRRRTASNARQARSGRRSRSSRSATSSSARAASSGARRTIAASSRAPSSGYAHSNRRSESNSSRIDAFLQRNDAREQRRQVPQRPGHGEPRRQHLAAPCAPHGDKC